MTKVVCMRFREVGDLVLNFKEITLCLSRFSLFFHEFCSFLVRDYRSK